MDTENYRTDYEYTTLMNMLRVSVSKHLLNDHFTLVWANPYYYELIGYSREEYEALYHGRCDRYYVNEALGVDDGAEWARIGAEVRRALSEGRPGYTLTSRMRRKNGDYLWVQMSATFVNEYQDGCQLSYTVMTDITETMQRQIEQSVAYDNLPGFVAKYRVRPGPQFTLLDANAGFDAFFGREWREMEGQSPLFCRNLRRNADVLATCSGDLLAGRPVHFTVHAEDQKGRSVWLQVNGACVDRQGPDPVYLAIFIDITDETELRRMQEKLELQAEQLKQALKLAERASRAKSDFLSHMSHDIRTPMNAIVGMTDIAKVHLNNPEKVKACLDKITLSSRHLLGLINDVLDMSKIENGSIALNPQPLSLAELLENVVTILQPSIQARQQNFSVQLQEVRHERYRSDALRLRQIFINLLSNASKFTPPGGSVTLELAELPGPDPSHAMLRAVVSDTGIGMSPAYLEHLFDPFSREEDTRTTVTEGSGLGMAITKRLVDLLGGEIRVQSREGEGSTFCVSLPLEIDETPPEEASFPGLRVLVVDDGEVTRAYVGQTLRRVGAEADCVANGADAVKKVVAAQRAGRGYDAVILDWKMPGMDGLQTARQLRREAPGDLPILIMSAYDWEQIAEQAHAAGVTGFLQKPVFCSTLCEGLRRFVLGRTAPEKAAPGYDFTGRRLLLVEDNELNREIAVELLQQVGAQVDTAANGELGVKKFRSAPEHFYALILMDVQMPVMDGLSAARVIRALPRGDAAQVPIVAMTADAFAEDVAAAKRAGMNAHIAKPIELQQLYRTIQKLLP